LPSASASSPPSPLSEKEESPAELSEAEAEASLLGSLGIVAAVASNPHPAKVQKGGEDAFFFRSSNNGGAIAVADGVGGYSEYGIDPGMFSRTLMLQMKRSERSLDLVDPIAALSDAQKETRLPGASTAVIVQLNGTEKSLTYANVGDSGLRVIRDGRIVFASEPLMHSFNCPYQLAYTRLSPNCQTADDADVGKVSVQPGDVLLAATDGLFDNLYDDDILEIVSAETDTQKERMVENGFLGFNTAKLIATALANEAYQKSMDMNYLSPFAKAKAENLGGFQFRKPIGGKPDDITVVIGLVSEGGKAGFESEVKQSDVEWTRMEARTEQLLEGSQDVMRATEEALNAAQSAGLVKEKESMVSSRGRSQPKQSTTGNVKFVKTQVDAMDKPTLQRTLQQLGLPTSGKIAALKQRLLDYRE